MFRLPFSKPLFFDFQFEQYYCSRNKGGDLMSLTSGSTLGQYEIITSIGAGGMGEVYRARDTKLGREVAIKVLPRVLAKEPERLARFEREARLLASLNHTNIAILHGLEQSDDTHFLVMELVSGETLRERISRGPISIKEALPIFQQLAEALEAAHENGVVHRDLKPANIKITEDGKVKVLDFGLAKAFSEEGQPADLSHSPTITRQGTETGVILGTAAYMSPEQARGKTLDKRTDIWSFGCVLYESLTGQAPFLGETVSDTMVRILEKEPHWEALPDDTPPFIRLLLHRCLQKDAKDRLHDIADARIEIRDASSEPLRALSTGELAAVPPRWMAGWKRAIPWVVAGMLGAIAVVSLWGPWRTPPPQERAVNRYLMSLSDGQTMRNVGIWGSAVTLSSDGSQLVYVVREGDTTRLYRRSMDSFEAEPIPGTEGARAPFFSPDGSLVGFYAGGEVKKVSLEGGALSTVTEMGATPFVGGDWCPDDTIIFSHCTYGLEKVLASGGTTEHITSVLNTPDEFQHQFPQLLPGGKAILFTIWNTPEDARIAVHDPTSGEHRTVLEPGTHARYVPTGHLVYAWEGELLAASFNLQELTVTGLPVRVLESVLMDENRGAAHFSVSDKGTLVYVPGGIVRDERTLVWVDRTGKVEPMPFPTADFAIRASPDGKHLLVSRLGVRGSGLDVWIYDLERGTQRRLTDEKGDEYWAAWTHGGQRVVYNSTRGESVNLYWKQMDGSGPEELFVESEDWLQPFSASADGNLFAFQSSDHPTSGFDIWVLPLEGDRQPRPFLQTTNNEIHPTLSPDGRWLAYASNESGRLEVYVQPYPGPGAVTPISTDGGLEPIWSPDGREIYYRPPGGDQVMSVSFSPTEPSPSVGKPRLLFEGRFAGGFSYGRKYDLAPDGKRFLMIQENEPPPPTTQYNVVLNWFEELKRLVPTEGN
jgi:serine/threonine-protein kinase